jgi:hypothetical protein
MTDSRQRLHKSYGSFISNVTYLTAYLQSE